MIRNQKIKGTFITFIFDSLFYEWMGGISVFVRSFGKWSMNRNQGEFQNNFKLKVPQGNSGKVRDVFVLNVMSQGKSGKKLSQ